MLLDAILSQQTGEVTFLLCSPMNHETLYTLTPKKSINLHCFTNKLN